MMKQYFIAWDSFPINLLQYIKEIAYRNVFTDVTLVSDDKVEFRAHQVILACFSEIFRDCVPEHQDTITILLPGIKSNVLQVLIDFIYTGNTTFEVNNMVKVEDLLEAGRCLRIQGIKEANFHQQNSDEKYPISIKLEEFKAEDEKSLRNKQRNFKRIFDLDERINILCSQCDFITKDDLEMKDHIILNHVEEERYCTICDNKSFPTWKKFRNHIRDVHKHQFRWCNHCEFLALSISDLKDHVAQIHSSKGSNIKCDQCSKKLPSQRNLKIHLAVKHGCRIFSCTECDYKTSYRKDSVRTHIESAHKGIRYYCKSCDYKGTTKANLRDHINSVHKNQRFYCNQCDVSSSQKGYINRHIKTDHEGHRFKCDKCDYMAKDAYVVRDHIKLKHDKIFLFCNICKYKTHNKRNLKSHTNKKHIDPKSPRKSIYCQLKGCKYVTKYNKNFIKHQEKNHFKTES